ncbi:MAG TPA: transferrin receptor-like dimerization domain-containing protein [Thermoanaerobaculia bacterium]|nr:transferrin receptor-like dimerization domain-containing protein [Thermoanaerobaculia bacterium]
MHRLLVVLLAFSALAQDKPMVGFTPASAAKQHALEQKFDANLNRDELREWMRRLSAHPHHLGSAYDKENAEFIASLFKSWGYDTTIETFTVLFPTPKTRIVELIAPEHVTLKLAETPLPQDATSGQTSEQLPTYNAYSTDGDVTGDLVYVNYGLPADYDELAKRGVDVKGRIVIARYGQSWRGIKPKVAAEHGAIGCIIYSDPHDDGYFEGDTYPKGAFRNENGAQRGSVADMPLYSGDPLTPGVGATADAKRLDRKDVQTITKIPVLPISYGDALPLLRALGGPVAPTDWRGALPITYHLGPGPSRVHMKLEFDWKLVPARDVIAKLPGTDRADEWVMHGNHYDAWVNGASDPISGMVAELEEARAVGELAKTGWRPRRTIIYAAWDGEEQGLLGSTEWVETHISDLQKHLTMYMNSDSNARGFLDAGGSHTLERFITQVAHDVTDPERNVSVFERQRAHDVMTAKTNTEKKAALNRDLIHLDALGSGSDFTPFLQHAGIAALSIGYDGESDGGSYHSIYDSFDHYVRFGDPTFDYGVVQAKTTGRITLRFADADLLPFEFTTLASTVGDYADEVSRLADDMRKSTEEQNRLLNEHVMETAADPTKTFVAPAAEGAVPYLNFAPLQNAVARLKKSADEFAKAYANALNTESPARSLALDRALQHAEQAFTRDEGLPRRPWYRHQIYAPGFYTGYGVKTLPGVREAIEQRRWSEANAQIAFVSKVIEDYAAEVDRASDIARGKIE